MPDLNVLFICSRNKWRSPTAENIWWREPGVSARSAGTSKSARRRVTQDDINWADVIFVMEEDHKDRLRDMFQKDMSGKSVHVLDIPDDYGFMDPELIEMIEGSTRPVIEDAIEQMRLIADR